MYPSPEISPRSVARTIRLIVVAVLLPAWHWAAADTVDAQLAGKQVAAGQPAELVLTATSSGSGPGLSPPDLSVLEDAFQVLDRKTQRRTSTINGRRREQVTLRLLLMPKHAGRLRVPAISFGSAKSSPLTLDVSSNGDRDSDRSTASTETYPAPGSYMTTDDEAGPSQQKADQSPWGAPGQGWGMQSSWASQWPSAPWPGNAFAPEGGGEEAQPRELPRFDPPRFDREEEASDQTETGQTEEGTSPWFSVSLVLAAALIVSLVKRRQPAAPGQPAPQVEAPPDPLTSATERVREAYRRSDAAAARDALLDWARLRWPDSPPNNLSRLSQRLQPPLRDHVTDLEKAFFSPAPIQICEKHQSQIHAGIAVLCISIFRVWLLMDSRLVALKAPIRPL